MPSRWVLGILSTDYDLRDYRRAIIERLAETNVCVSAFEQPDFPDTIPDFFQILSDKA